eukprot:753224-Hanusia_phi.AAC.2
MNSYRLRSFAFLALVCLSICNTKMYPGRASSRPLAPQGGEEKREQWSRNDVGTLRLRGGCLQERAGAEARQSMRMQGERDMVRLMLQALQGMGYLESALCLQRESGVVLNPDEGTIRALRRDVMEGQWRKLLSQLEGEEWASAKLR